jgi:hypothetical protein
VRDLQRSQFEDLKGFTGITQRKSLIAEIRLFNSLIIGTNEYENKFSTTSNSRQSNNDFLQGDTVVLIAPVTLVNRTFDTGDLLSVEYITSLGGIGVTTNGVIVVVVDPTEVRHATTLELKLNAVYLLLNKP